MISANETWILWSIIIVIATASIYLENHYEWASKISGPIIGLLAAATLSNVGIIPVESPVYDQVWDIVVPLAIPMLLFTCDLKQIWKESGRLLMIFLISSVGTILGALVGYAFLGKLIPVLNHIAGMMVGSYIGGGVNFVAVASAFDIPKELISAATVADNLLMVFYFLILLMIPSMAFFKKHFKSAYSNKELEDSKEYHSKTVVTLQDIAFVFAIAVVIVTESFSLSKGIATLGQNSVIQFISNKYLILTTLTVAASTIFSSFFKKIHGANEIGTFLIYLFFVVIGIPASIEAIIAKSPLLLVFCAIMVFVNMFMTFLGAKVFGFTIEEAILASNANIGGPTTAAAMAVSKGWYRFVAPTMLVGTLGYILGTYIGILVGNLLI